MADVIIIPQHTAAQFDDWSVEIFSSGDTVACGFMVLSLIKPLLQQKDVVCMANDTMQIVIKSAFAHEFSSGRIIMIQQVVELHQLYQA